MRISDWSSDVCSSDLRLDKEGQARLEAAATAMAVRGMRVLGVAAGRVPREVAAKDHLEHDFELLGLVGLKDPLRPGVKEAIAQCRTAGIRVIMITGDYADRKSTRLNSSH